MARTAADVLVDTLSAWGVEVVFGLPGDGINGIMESLRTAQDRIRFVQVRHEEAAALAACGYAKFTGRLGVCLATSGPGGIHLLNGLYDAKMDGQPVLALTGHTYHDLIGTYYQQDVDLDRLFMDVAVYSQRVMGVAHVRSVTNLAIRHALARRGVAAITFPNDLQVQEVGEDQRSEHNVPDHTAAVPTRSLTVPVPAELWRAAGLLNRGQKVAILAGRGALGATDELETMADLLAAPIIKAYLGKGAVPDDSPYTTGGIGLLGTKPSEVALEQCDTLLLVGTSFPYMDFLPRPGQAVGVQIDSDPVRIGLRYPVEVGLVGDARATLELLLPLLRRKTDRGFLEQAQEGMRAWWTLLEAQASRGGKPMKPQTVAWELSQRLADDAIVTGDSGTTTTWLARYIQARRGQMISGSGNLATMASGLPYAIAAQVAYPKRQVVAVVGDGGFSMLMAEFATAVKYQLPIKVVVFKNNTLGQIKWEQMVFLGNPEYGVSLQPIDFVKFAEACGGRGFSVDDPGQVGQVLDRALVTDGPVVVEAVVDPYEPPMPAQVTPKQAFNMAKALARGEPNRARIAATLFRDKITDFAATLPGNGRGPLATVRAALRRRGAADELEA
ncbi:MAG: thiamine pyrophosphate-binding protein [Sphaerobacter sp.]|nr:thiamine pyrophosphate-binding protein [Sphaerobacter sp.]